MNKNNLQVLMIDSSIGNEYSACLAEGIKNSGIDISLVTTTDKEFFIKPVFNLKLWAPSKSQEVNKLGKAFTYLSYQFKIIFYTLTHRNIVVHFQFFRRRFDSIVFTFLALLTKRIFLTAHNVLPHENKKIDIILNNLVYKSAAGLVVHTEFIKQKLLNNFKVRADKIHVIPHGNFDFFVDEHVVNEKEARNIFNLKYDDNVLLFFGNIREYKGLDLLLDAFDNAADKDEKLKLLIAGNPYNEELKNIYVERINNLKYRERVSSFFNFIPIEDVKNYFVACDLIVLPYHKIDHSGIIHLSYSFGKPVLANRVGDFIEVIEPGLTGYLTDNNDPDNLTEWINRSFADKDKLKDMGINAINLNDTTYSWKRIAGKTIEMYSK